MIAGLDSATMPNTAQVAAAKAAGVRIWSGYLATKAGVGLENPWTKTAFDIARGCGSTPIAYCSGWDSAADCKARAAQWNVRLCLDVESGIRGAGGWMQAWLDASGAGLYANPPYHAGMRAAFHVCAAYPGGNPSATWPRYIGQPSTPCGWQYQGTHSEFGVSVDRSWFDDWFASTFGPSPGTLGGFSVTAEEQIAAIYQATTQGFTIQRVMEALGATNPDNPAIPPSPLLSKILSAAQAGGSMSTVDVAAVTALLEQIKTNTAADATTATLVATLSKHLGVGTP